MFSLRVRRCHSSILAYIFLFRFETAPGIPGQGAPQSVGDIFNPTNGNTRQIRFYQSLFYTAFPALIALDNRCLEGLAA